MYSLIKEEALRENQTLFVGTLIQLRVVLALLSLQLKPRVSLSALCKTQVSLSPFQCLPTQVLKHISKQPTFPASLLPRSSLAFRLHRTYRPPLEQVTQDPHPARATPVLQNHQQTHQAGRTPSFGYKRLVIDNSTEGAEKDKTWQCKKPCVKCLSSCRSWSVP